MRHLRSYMASTEGGTKTTSETHDAVRRQPVETMEAVTNTEAPRLEPKTRPVQITLEELPRFPNAGKKKKKKNNKGKKRNNQEPETTNTPPTAATNISAQPRAPTSTSWSTVVSSGQKRAEGRKKEDEKKAAPETNSRKAALEEATIKPNLT